MMRIIEARGAEVVDKWLSMMQKRLKLAKSFLNPRDSALIVTIDEYMFYKISEYHDNSQAGICIHA